VEPDQLLLPAAQQVHHRLAVATVHGRVVVAKGDNAHEYKFPVAAFENFGLVNPRWRPHVLGAATSYLRSTRYPESETMLRARAALRRG